MSSHRLYGFGVTAGKNTIDNDVSTSCLWVVKADSDTCVDTLNGLISACPQVILQYHCSDQITLASFFGA